MGPLPFINYINLTEIYLMPRSQDPDPIKSGPQDPDPIKSGSQDPDPIKSRSQDPDPIKSKSLDSNLVKSGYKVLDPDLSESKS